MIFDRSIQLTHEPIRLLITALYRLRFALTSSAGLVLGEDALLSVDLILQVLYLLLRLSNLDGDLEQVLALGAAAHVAVLQGLVLLSEVLKLLDLIEQLVEEEERLGAQLLVQDLRVEVPRLDGHVNLIDEHLELLRGRRPRANSASRLTLRWHKTIIFNKISLWI
jgi:hypothetical protein